MSLPKDDKSRKELPIFRGPLMYFPDAIAELARVCKIGNDQHNPGEPLHWARGKSMEQMDTALRHMMDHGTGTTRDIDGAYHMAKAAWRCLAELQLTIERDRAATADAEPAANSAAENAPASPAFKIGDIVRVEGELAHIDDDDSCLPYCIRVISGNDFLNTWVSRLDNTRNPKIGDTVSFEAEIMRIDDNDRSLPYEVRTKTDGSYEYFWVPSVKAVPTTPADLQVGDRVRVLDEGDFSNNVGTLVEIDPHDRLLPYRVHVTRAGRSRWFNAVEIVR